MRADLFDALQWQASKIRCRWLMTRGHLLLQLHIGPTDDGFWLTIGGASLADAPAEYSPFRAMAAYVMVLAGTQTFAEAAQLLAQGEP
jgi:hypothetical protein